MMVLLIYLGIMNVLALLFMLSDKIKSKKNIRRIPERTLLTLCALGGSLGGLLGMALLRHKIRKGKFALGIPVMLIFQVLAIAWICYIEIRQM